MDVKTIEKIIKIVQESDFVEFDYRDDEVHLILKKKDAFVQETVQAPQTPVVVTQPQQQAEATPKPTETKQKETEKQTKPEGLEEIRSPMVATFYRAPSPTSPPYVEEGDEVKKGDVLCILEAMKIMNELEAEFPCRIEKILVENGQKVEYDQPLFLVKRLG